MSTQSPTVIADRLRQARLAAGLTLEALSERLEGLGHPLTRAALSKYETGKSLPRQATLVALARTLGVRVDFFVREPSARIVWHAFRKHASLSKSLQAQVQASVAQVVEGHVWLEETLEPGQKHRFPPQQRARTAEDAEAAAALVRKQWKLGDGPIESVTQTVEDHGGIVVSAAQVPPDFDGLSGWANDSFPVLVSSARPALDRRRYNFAHELGHLAMDCEGLSEDDEERLAHRFAAAFLVPASVARRELGERRRNVTLQELMLLKQKYGLSMQAWARRARDLGIIDTAVYNRLWAQFSAKGWRKQEPVVFMGSEEPMRLKLLVMRALAEGVITPSRAEELCPGCTQEPGAAVHADPTRPSVQALRQLSPEQREEALRQSAAAVEADYAQGGELTAFEAFGDDDLYVEP